MYHTVEFAVECHLAVEISPKQPMERVLVYEGTRVRAQLKPYVIETDDGPVEVADLFFEDDTATRAVPFARFTLVD